MITQEQIEMYLKTGDLRGVTLEIEHMPGVWVEVTIADFDYGRYFYTHEGHEYTEDGAYMAMCLIRQLARQQWPEMKP